MAAQTSSTSSTASGTTSSDTIASAPTRVSPPPTTVNLGPLTTTFYPPDGCTSQTDVALGNANGQRGNPSIVLYGTLDQYSYCSFSAARHSAVKSCFPPNFGSYYNVVPTSGSGDVYPVYSPGLVCPAGYGPSCTFTKTTSSLPYIPDRDAVDYTIQQILKDCQTAIGCCPSNYACHTSSYMLCISTAQAESSFRSTHNYCTKIQYASMDVAVASASEGTSTFLVGPQVLLIHDPTSTPYYDPGGGGSSNNGLSTGAKVAIGVTIPIVVMMLALLAFLFIHRRRRRHQRTKGEEKGVASASAGSPRSDDTDLYEYDSKGQTGGNSNSSRKDSPWVPAELDNGAVPELLGDCQFPEELDGKAKPAELGERQPYLSYTNTPVDTDAEWETESDADSEIDTDSVKSAGRAKRGHAQAA